MATSQSRRHDDDFLCVDCVDGAKPCTCGGRASAPQSICPFCRIADGDPDGQVLARAFGCMIFAPLNPVTPGHALVVPEVHVEDFAQNPAVSGAAMMAAAAWVGDGDFNVITSKGRFATQTVGHLHLHIVPRVNGDGLRLPWTPNEKRAEHPWEMH